MKLNAVVERGVNDDEILALAEFGRDHGVQVRFIEFMPLDATGHWSSTSVVSQDEIVAAIAAVHPLELVPARGSAPADRWRYLDGRGEVGVIPTVTKPFCGDCDRVRITAEGQFRTCLFATREFDLRALLRGGASDDELAAEIVAGSGHEVGRARHRPGGLRASEPLHEPDRRLILPCPPGETALWLAAPRLGPCPISASPTSIRSAGRAWSMSRRRSPRTGVPWPAAR